MAWTKFSLLFILGYLTLIIATEQTSEENIQAAQYSIYAKRSADIPDFPYYPSYDLDGGIRLKKWATQLRFGKRGSSWASQVRFG